MRFAYLAIVAFSLVVGAAPASGQSILKDAGSALKGLGGGSGGSAGLSSGEVAGGLKDALSVGVDTVTGNLGAANGFFNDPVARIPLPGYMQTAQKVMRFAGQGELLDDVELRINRAAEASMEAAKEEFGTAIKAMTFQDAQAILEGPDDSATRYFEEKTTKSIAARMRPILKSELAKSDAFAAYDRAAEANGAAGLAPRGKTMLIDHSVKGALKGLFHYIAEEEAAIRNNPAKRITPLLQKVFG